MDDTVLPALSEDARRVATVALAEDGPLDITSEVSVAADARGKATIEARSNGILAGTHYADAAARGCALSEVKWQVSDGDAFVAGQRLGTLEGSLRAILRVERPLLNLLQRACGIATATRAYVDLLQGTGCRLLHTRKTLPGLRAFDIRAVLAGGGALHRIDLSRTVLIKDNHWRALEAGGRSVESARVAARARGVNSFQVEVESASQVDAACAAGATRILVDNQSPQTLKEWGARARRLSPAIEVEASGGLSLSSVRAYADAGADFVSVGALTHSNRALDIALKVTAVDSDS